MHSPIVVLDSKVINEKATVIQMTKVVSQVQGLIAEHCGTLGCCSRKCATAMAFSECFSILRASVFRLRWRRKASKGAWQEIEGQV